MKVIEDYFHYNDKGMHQAQGREDSKLQKTLFVSVLQDYMIQIGT